MIVESDVLVITRRSGIEAYSTLDRRRLWAASADQPVSAAAASAGTVYVTGPFRRIAGAARSGMAAFNLKSGRLLPWQGPGLRDVDGALVGAGLIALSGSRVFLAGDFSYAGSRRVSGLVVVDAVSGRLLPWRDMGAPGAVYGLVAAGGELVVMREEDRFYAVNATTGSPSAWTRRVSGLPTVAAADGLTVYLGAKCSAAIARVGAVDVHNIGAFDLSTRAGLDWKPEVRRFTCVSGIAIGPASVMLWGGFSERLG